MPALCYALDENILSDANYELLKDADFSIIENATPNYFVAVVLVFVRNFYENGRGDNYWGCTPSCVALRERFIDCIDRNIGCQRLGFLNEFFPATGTGIDNWVISQCWMLKVHDGSGRTSRMLSSNAAVYHLFEEQFGNVSWEDLIAGTLDEEINGMELSPCYFRGKKIPPYVRFLFENYRKTYLLSLIAMSMDKDIQCPEGVPTWVEKIWGAAYTDMHSAQRNLPSVTNSWKIVVNGNFRDLVLSYRLKKFKHASLLQDDCNIALGESGQISMSTLLSKGFDVHQRLIIKGETETGGCRQLVVPALRKDAAVFRSFDCSVQERRLISAYGRVSYAPNNRKLYIVSSQPIEQISLTYDKTPVILHNDGKICRNYMCYRAELPATQHPAKSPLIVNQTHILDLIERPFMTLLNAEKNMKLEYDNTNIDVIIGNKLRIYREGHVSIEPVQLNEMLKPGNEVEYEISPDNMGIIHTITVKRQDSNVTPIVRRFICLPEDWKNQGLRPSDADLYAAAKKNKTIYRFSSTIYGLLDIFVPIDKTYCFWVREDFSVTTDKLKSLEELREYVRAEAYSNNSVELDIRYDGRRVEGYPDAASRIYSDDLEHDVINLLPRFARRRLLEVTFNNRPVFSVTI